MTKKKTEKVEERVVLVEQTTGASKIKLKKPKDKKKKRQDYLAKLEQIEAHIENGLEAFQIAIEKRYKDMRQIENMIAKLVIGQNKKLDKLENAVEITENTNTNILLAIRQNEYLQAWYPAQGGYKEMQVVGEHPCVTKRRLEKKK